MSKKSKKIDQQIDSINQINLTNKIGSFQVSV